MLNFLVMLALATTQIHAADPAPTAPPALPSGMEMPTMPPGQMPPMPSPPEQPEVSGEPQAPARGDSAGDKAAADKARKIMHDQLLQRSNEERGVGKKKKVKKETPPL